MFLVAVLRLQIDRRPVSAGIFENGAHDLVSLSCSDRDDSPQRSVRLESFRCCNNVMVRSAGIRFFVELQPNKFHLPYALPRCGEKPLAIATRDVRKISELKLLTNE